MGDLPSIGIFLGNMQIYGCLDYMLGKCIGRKMGGNVHSYFFSDMVSEHSQTRNWKVFSDSAIEMQLQSYIHTS